MSDKLNRNITKDQGYRMSVTVVASWIPVIAAFWFVAKPVLINAVSDAVADDIKEQVKSEVAPINGAFIVLLQRDIDKVRREIAALEFRQRTNDNWTAIDARSLADKRIELDALQDAMAALKGETT